MEEFWRSYNRLCKESGAEPQEAVLQQLHQLPRGGLDLTSQSLTVDTCRALGKLLPKETLLKELVLSDCMLSEEGEARGLHATLRSGAQPLHLPAGCGPQGGWPPFWLG